MLTNPPDPSRGPSTPATGTAVDATADFPMATVLDRSGPRAHLLRDTRSLALASSAAVATAATVWAAAAGRDALADPASALDLARDTTFLALPGLLLAAVAPRLARSGRQLAGLAALAALLATALATGRVDNGGALLLPAFGFLVAAVAVGADRPPLRAETGPTARSDLVATAGWAAVAGLAARAAALDRAGTEPWDRVGAIALLAGAVLAAWPLLALALVPARWHHRWLVAATVVVAGTVVLGGPTGSEPWLVPAVVVLVTALLLPPAPAHPGDDPVVVVAGVCGLLLIALQVVGGAVDLAAVTDRSGRAALGGPQLALVAGAALVPVVVARVARRRAGRLLAELAAAGGLAIVGLVVAGDATDTQPRTAVFAVPPLLILVACRPRLRLAAWRGWRPLAGAVTVAAVVAGLVVAAAPAERTTSLALNGGRVADARAAIADADARFLTDTLGTTQRPPGARCYFVGETSAPVEQVACGPVVHPPAPTSGTEVSTATDTGTEADAGEGPWDLYPARAVHGDLHLGDPRVGQTIDLDSLRRPDGLEPPDAGAPIEPTVAPGFTRRLALGDEPDAATPGSPTSGFVIAGTGRVVVAEVAEPDVVRGADGEPRQAPDGYRLVAARLTFRQVEGVTLEVLSGGDRLDVTATVTDDDGETYHDGWVVATVRDDGFDPLLEVTYRGRGQRLSLATGERRGGPPLLYHPLDEALDATAAPTTVVVEDPDHDGVDVDVAVGGYAVVRVGLNVFARDLGWAPEGQAWLVVVVRGLHPPTVAPDPPSRLAGAIARLDVQGSFGLPADDRDQAPAGVAPTADGDLAVAFAIDDVTRQATVEVHPIWRILPRRRPQASADDDVPGEAVVVLGPRATVPIDLR